MPSIRPAHSGFWTSVKPHGGCVVVCLDRGYGTCEIDWAKASYSIVYKSYIISILVFCFLLPVALMLFSYVSIINTVKRGNALTADGDISERQRKIERDVTIVTHTHTHTRLSF